MIARIHWQGKTLSVDYSKGRSLAIPMNLRGPQPAFFVDAPARAEPLKSGDYIGSVAQGGSCNAEQITLVPHCHGTHTECVGHITHQGEYVQDTIHTQPCLARLVTMQGEADSKDNYPTPLEDGDSLLTLDKLRQIVGDITNIEALIIRTLPNPESKQFRDYGQQPAYPVLSSQAIQWLADSQLKHLLLDTPSLDKANDGGQLANHKQWWKNHPQRSISEMIYVPDQVSDADYWLHLELSPILSDACSSRPVIYPLIDDTND